MQIVIMLWDILLNVVALSAELISHNERLLQFYPLNCQAKFS